MPRRVESRQIPAHAGPDQPHIAVAAGSRFDHAQLPAEGQSLEIACAQIGDLHRDANLLKAPAKELRLARHGTGREAVQINELHGWTGSRSVLIGLEADRTLGGTGGRRLRSSISSARMLMTEAWRFW